MEPKIAATVIKTGGGLAAKGAKGFANTKTGKTLIHNIVQKGVDKTNTNRLKRMVKNSPLVGSDQKDELAPDRVRKIFNTEFVDLLFRD